MKASILLCILGTVLLGCTENSPVGPDPPAAPITAAARFADVNSLASSYKKGLRLLTVSSTELSTDGFSAVWHFQYVDTTAPYATYWFHAISSGVGFDSNATLAVGIAPITHGWFNSDSAMRIAERNGGFQFRSDNPNCMITAGLGEPVVPDPATTWWITYRSADDHSVSLLLGIDATTGAISLKYPE
jgi:hypothetical protein